MSSMITYSVTKPTKCCIPIHKTAFGITNGKRRQCFVTGNTIDFMISSIVASISIRRLPSCLAHVINPTVSRDWSHELMEMFLPSSLWLQVLSNQLLYQNCGTVVDWSKIFVQKVTSLWLEQKSGSVRGLIIATLYRIWASWNFLHNFFLTARWLFKAWLQKMAAPIISSFRRLSRGIGGVHCNISRKQTCS